MTTQRPRPSRLHRVSEELLSVSMQLRWVMRCKVIAAAQAGLLGQSLTASS